jgi:hypothetical protein
MKIEIGEKWKHVKSGGEYEIVGVGRLQVKNEDLDMAECVIYKSLQDSGEYKAGCIWVRPMNDFLDGRFVKIL